VFGNEHARSRNPLRHAVSPLGTYSVEVRDLVKYHGATPAVDHCSFSLRPGEFFSLIGPSGSGKTTTLRLLAGFEQPDHGELLIEGRSMRRVPPNHRPVNLVFQNYALFPHLSVYKNVAFGLEMRRMPAQDVRSRVGAALEMVKLHDKPDRMPSQLSGGEQQRVALARALVNRPAVVLLDEPLGALDQQLRQDMRVELKAIQAHVGLTFIAVTHDQEEALTMSDRMAVMNRGRILQVGSPREIYELPASVFVATFVGHANRADGRVEMVDAGVCHVHVPGLPRIVARHHTLSAAGTQVTLMVRPERLALSREPMQSGYDNVVQGRIEKAVYNGSDMRYWLRVTDQTRWIARVGNVGDEKAFSVGESVYARWNAADGVALTE
jgi:spermidine/putrescine transport system ATP-binding protein